MTTKFSMAVFAYTSSTLILGKNLLHLSSVNPPAIGGSAQHFVASTLSYPVKPKITLC
ncbi:hypothetical protein Patl1_26267 [Pistacia atlantica]|uniref:Uncharacterized protein n=1 Tax=Pistacia atlantica TaxID=434234 RepID=A0ACC1B3Z9_9ROSI|nr:hypothetical protein Patl1_26267 [Pistacia atlantica]